MARYKNQLGQIVEVGSPELNLGLVAGLTPLPDTGAITANDLTPTSVITPIQPQPSSIPSVPEVPELNVPETEAQKLIEEIRALTTEGAGEATFKTEQEQLAGVPEAQQAVDDLTQRLRDLVREEKAIPLRLQEEIKGRGVTKGGLAPIQAGELRKNAIEALSVSALIDASSNRLLSAQRKADRAVDAKYAPIKAERDAKLANLELILKSPLYTRADKERAEKQKAEQEKLKTDEKTQEDTMKEILKFAQTYMTNSGKEADSSVIQQFQDLALNDDIKREDIFAAQKILAGSGFAEKKVDRTLSISEAKSFGVPFGIKESEVIGKIPSKEIQVEFTSSQIADGAANADLPIAEFQKLDVDTQNFFINRKSDIDAKKKLIDAAKENKE